MTDLSPRQLEVLTLLADGYRDRDIAPHLHVSISTVRQHVEDIRHKLDANTRAHAIAIAYRTGVLTIDQAGADA